MKLSIIIPVYRTQYTLKRCVESILQQSFTDYEVILVDDGSPDECPLICDEYAKREKRISVIHKKNGGLSSARNAGVKAAKGEYVTFADSDDAMEEGTLQGIMGEMHAHPYVDMLEYPALERIGHPYKEKLLTFTPTDYDNAIDYWLAEQAYFHTYACNKVFRKELFVDVKFPEGKTFEDVHTIPYLIGLIPTEHGANKNVRIRVTNIGRYLYYWNGNGITANAKYQDLTSLYVGLSLALIHTFKKIENDDGAMRKHQISINIFLTQILNVLLDIYDVSGRYENCSPLIKYAKLIKQKGLIKSPKLKILLTLGFHILCKINRLIHKIYRRQS